MKISIFFPAGALIAAGLLALSSISLQTFYLQCLWVIIGILCIVLFKKIDAGVFLANRWFAWSIYGFAVLLLVAAYFVAPSIRGVRSWLVLGPIRFQPVELVKIGLVLVYANYFSRRHLAIARMRHIAASFLIFFIPAGLTILQPDLGSVLILFGIWFCFLLASGLPRRWIALSCILFSVAAVVAWNYFLADYQKERIAGVLYPERDALGINYSAIQSRIAVGSAGLWGKGYGQGTQTQFGFLTEPSTDFIFSAFVEEWGIISGLLIMAIFLWLVIVVLGVGVRSKTNFGKFLCIGTALIWGLHFTVNIGSALGFIPVIGVTLPFISYGGSSLLTNFFLLAIIYIIDERSYG